VQGADEHVKLWLRDNPAVTEEKAREYGWASLSRTRSADARNYKLNFAARPNAFPCLAKAINKSILIHHIALQIAYLKSSQQWDVHEDQHGVEKAKADLALDMLQGHFGGALQRSHLKPDLPEAEATSGWAAVQRHLVGRFWSHVQTHQLDDFLESCYQTPMPGNGADSSAGNH
jgi:hypothetical protein